MQQRQTRLPELPEFGGGNLLFSLKEVTYSPETPRLEEPFVVKGKVELFGIPYVAPLWVIAKVTYPLKWWEEIIPIWGSPTVGEGQMALGGDFEITFPKGFDREGEFSLAVEVHLGPTYTLDSITLPPFPPLASEETVFIVAGDVPPEEAGFRNFRVLSYSKNGGTPVMPPGVLELEVGDRCRVNVAFDHRNSAVTAEFHAAIWQDTLLDPHDEVLDAEKVFSVPSSVDWESWEGSIDIIITSAISPGSEYGLYVKIMGITGGDIFTEYLANVITIVGPPPAADIRNFDFQLTKGTYNVGDAVPWTAPYEYVGPAQSGRLTISIGTGIYPTFNPVHTYAPVTINFEEALSWTARALQGNITLPSTLQPGQTYSVRAKLETTTYPTQETDTDWSAFDVTPIGPPTSDIRNFDFRAEGGTYDLGDRVGYTAPYEYKGKAQGGWLTVSLGTGAFPSFFTKHTFARVAVSFEQAMDWASGQLSGSFALPTTLEPGQTYSVRAKLETADGKQETDTDWGVITIREEVVPPEADIKNFDFRAIPGTYDLGDRVSYTAPYEYKGKAQSGYLTISLGTGVSPSFLTKYTYPRKAVTFKESMDWTSGQLSGNFTLPTTLEPGQTYSVRAKLETADGKQETDTDWGVITIREEVVPPEADIKNFDFGATPGTYDIGDKVPFTAVYEYKGKAQSGRLTISLGTGIYPSFSTKYTYSPISVDFEESMDWRGGTIDGNFTLPPTLEPGQTYSVRAKLEAISDYTQETDTDWSAFNISEAPPVGISFEMGIWGAPDDFPSYDYWMCYYWDNGIGDFVSDQKWYRPSEKIEFTNIRSGQNGYVAVFLRKGSTASRQYSSPRWNAVNGGNYTYDIDINYIYGA